MVRTNTDITIDLDGLQDLVDLLRAQGFTVRGPTARDGAVVPGRIASVEDLPRGWGDVQEPGSYRLRRRTDDALFGFAADAITWKTVLFPSRELIWKGTRTPGGFDLTTSDPTGGDLTGGLGNPPYALLGIRSCDLHAVVIHDRVLRDRPRRPPDELSARADHDSGSTSRAGRRRTS